MARKPAARTPAFVTPMAAEPVAALPEGEDWTYEAKLDGYRALLIKDGAHVELRSRNDKDLSQIYPRLTAMGARLKPSQVVLDGEIVALDSEGRPAFQALQHRSSHPGHTIVFYVFDLLHLNGRNWTDKPLKARRAQLPTVVGDSGLKLSLPLPGHAADVVNAVRALGLEGVIAKRAESSYQPGERSSDWQKLKLEQQQEFVVGGFRSGSHGIDALLVGYYEGRNLRFGGKVRAGFVPHVRRELFQKLKPLIVRPCPFSDLPTEGSSRWGGGVTEEDMREMTWTKPQLVAQIRFTEWTAEGRLRHAAYLGLRDDKSPKDVGRESPIDSDG
jgi:DNA ligase D-like protein (predicted ligase)